MPKIELWIIDSRTSKTQIIPNVACVPPLEATIDTEDGMRIVVRQHFDYHAETGDCRVHLTVT